MIRHLIRTSLLFLTFCNGYFFGADQEVKVIHSMLDIHPFVTSNSVVILDLDNTLITTTTDLGNAEWYYSWLQVEQAKGVSRQEAQKSLQSTWLWLQNFAEYQLTESNIPYLLKSLRQSPDVTLFSITGRVPESSKVTQDVLDKLNISLLKPSQAKWEFNFYTPPPYFL
ncbi:MAG: DUF2608 domain-containing protein [Chlamydiales bacterium]|nr:DUF2608 domain-containing protein [Chlamydiales bacterium]